MIGSSPCDVLAQDSETSILTFQDRLDEFLRTKISTGSRPGLVVDAEQFLADFPDHPRRAEVMVRIAEIYRAVYAEPGTESMTDESILWYRRAYEEAEVGSKAWYNICTNLPFMIRYFEKTSDAFDESREILEAFAKHAESITDQAKAEYELLKHYYAKGDPAGIEQHAYRLLDWHESHEETLTPDERTRIDQFRSAAAIELMGLAVQADAADAYTPERLKGTREHREAYIKDLVTQYPELNIEKLANVSLHGLAQRRPALAAPRLGEPPAPTSDVWPEPARTSDSTDGRMN